MKTIILLLIASVLGFSNANAQESKVPYNLAKGYVLQKDYPNARLQLQKITNQEQFEGVFAPNKNEKDQPTAIDFTKSYVITVINEKNRKDDGIYTKTLTKDGDNVTLHYDFKKLPKSTSSDARHFELLIVDRSYLGEVTGRRYTSSNAPMTGDDLNEGGCKSSTGSSWSVLESDCIQPWSTKYILMGGRLNPALLFNTDGSKAEILGLNLLYDQFEFNMILQKVADNRWVKGDLELLETEKDTFLLREKGVELMKGRLRK